MNMRVTLLSLLAIVLMMNTSRAQQVHPDIYHPCAHHKAMGASMLPESVNAQLQDYDVTFYHLDLNVSSLNTTVSGKVKMEAKVTASSLDTLVLDLMNYLTVDSVRVNGITRSFFKNNDQLFILISPALAPDAAFSSVVHYHGTPPSSGFFSGITSAYNSTYGKRVTWTLSEPFNARQWWPCKQDLTDKADSSWCFLTTDAGEMAGSNGLLTNVVSLSGNKKRYEWKSKYPIAYYLISFSVADYQDYSIYCHPQGLGDSILIQNFIYDHPNCLPNNQAAINATADLIELYSDKFGMYPFPEEKYGHCLAQIGGGMEHQTMTTLGSFNFELVAHELGHMWYGDDITCATWSDIWINEGFASYTEYVALENLYSPADARWWMTQVNNNVMSQPDGSTYVPPSQAVPGNDWRIFNGRLSYNKGASILQMLRWELGSDSLFFHILRTYSDQYGDSVATGDDFRDVVSAVTGQNWAWFFDQWYYGEGYPTHNIVWHQVGNELIMNVHQSASWPSVTPFFKMHLELRVLTSQGESFVRIFHENPSQVHTVAVQGTVNSVQIDPNEWTLDMPGSIAVGLGEPEQGFVFNIFPNPATQSATLSLECRPGASVSYRLFDVSGRQVMEGKAQNGNNTLDISTVEGGTYMLRLTDGQHVSSRPIVKL